MHFVQPEKMGINDQAGERLVWDCLEPVHADAAGESVKGMSGALATIGGCREYTGAPFFASMTCLKVGATPPSPSPCENL